MSAPDYELTAGTVIGEVRNEIFNKHGLSAYENAKYGWHHSRPNETTMKIYNLVSGSSIQFLLATVTYPIKEILPRPIETGSYMQEISDNVMVEYTTHTEEVSGSLFLITSHYEEISGSMTLVTSSEQLPSQSIVYVTDFDNPSELNFSWYDANIPFLDKDVLDNQNISYILN
jgi:hypothetical protein